MTIFWIISSMITLLILVGLYFYTKQLLAASYPDDLPDRRPNASNVREWSSQEHANWLAKQPQPQPLNTQALEGLSNLYADIIFDADNDSPGALPEDGYAKKLRLNVAHEAELAAKKAHKVAYAAAWYQTNRERLRIYYKDRDAKRSAAKVLLVQEQQAAAKQAVKKAKQATYAAKYSADNHEHISEKRRLRTGAVKRYTKRELGVPKSDANAYQKAYRDAARATGTTSATFSAVPAPKPTIVATPVPAPTPHLSVPEYITYGQRALA